MPANRRQLGSHRHAPRSARRRGVALLLLLIVSAGVAGTAAAYLATTSIRMAASDNYADAIDVGYAAESGVEHGLCLLAENSSLLNNTNTAPLGPFQNRLGGPTYTVSAVSIGNGQYRFTGKGIRGQCSRTCVAVARLDNGFVQVLDSLGPRMRWRLGDTSGSYAVEQMVNRWGQYVGWVSLNQAGALAGDNDGSVRFDGSRTRAVIWHDARMASAQGTVLLWFYDGSSYTNEGLLSKDAEARGTGGGLAIALDKDRIHVKLESATADNKIEVGGLACDTWYLLTLTFGPAGMKLYVNDQVAGSNAYTGGMVNNTEPVVLGALQNSRKVTDVPYLTNGLYSAGLTNFFSGRLDEVAFFDRALSAAEVARLYAARRPSVRVLQWQT